MCAEKQKMKSSFCFVFGYYYNIFQDLEKALNLVAEQFLLNAFLLGKDYLNVINRTINLLLRGTFKTLVFIAFMGNTSKVL